MFFYQLSDPGSKWNEAFDEMLTFVGDGTDLDYGDGITWRLHWMTTQLRQIDDAHSTHMIITITLNSMRSLLALLMK